MRGAWNGPGSPAAGMSLGPLCAMRPCSGMAVPGAGEATHQPATSFHKCVSCQPVSFGEPLSGCERAETTSEAIVRF